MNTIDLLKLFLFGATQFGLGLVFLTIGAQMVSATERRAYQHAGDAAVAGHEWQSNRVRVATVAHVT